MTVLTTKVDDNNNNNNNSANNNNNSNRGGGPISIIRVCNNNHTTNTYKKLEHTHESDLEYSKLKDDYYKFKISDLIHCSPTFWEMLAFKMTGNSGDTIKDITKHYVLIMYIKR